MFELVSGQQDHTWNYRNTGSARQRNARSHYCGSVTSLPVTRTPTTKTTTQQCRGSIVAPTTDEHVGAVFASGDASVAVRSVLIYKAAVAIDKSVPPVLVSNTQQPEESVQYATGKYPIVQCEFSGPPCASLWITIDDSRQPPVKGLNSDSICAKLNQCDKAISCAFPGLILSMCKSEKKSAITITTVKVEWQPVQYN